MGIARSQTSPGGYAQKWKVVDSLMDKKGLTQSALREVNGIYTLARQEKNQPQMIRALVYRLTLQQVTSEDAGISSIKALQMELETSGQPERSILQNILAGVYLDYLQNHRWEISGRINTSPSPGADITAWSVDDLDRHIRDLYLASLKDEDLLAQTMVSAYQPIVIPGNTPGLRPTLFDLMAHAALDYFKNGESITGSYTTPLEVDDPFVFADAETFAGHRFAGSDSLSPAFRAIPVFQRLIRRHLGDKIPNALLDLDIERIGLARSIYTSVDRDEQYLKSLSRITDRYGSIPAADQAWYLQADAYFGPGTGGLDSLGNCKARAICEKVVARKDSSEGWANCRGLLHRILVQELDLQTEKVNVPDRPIRALVTWRNFTQLYFRIVRMDEDTRLFFSARNILDSDYLPRLYRMPAYRSLARELPDTRDYLEHRVEIGLGPLPPGDYMLLGCTDSSWSRRSGVLAAGQFSVSLITFMSLGDDYFVLNRETGRPIAAATVQSWNRVRQDGKPADLKKRESYTTDENGHFLMKAVMVGDYKPWLLEISIPGDHLFPFQGFYHYSIDRTPAGQDDKASYERNNRNFYFFTDRSIYRPGQTVFFKGIVVTKDFDTHRAKPAAGDSSRLFLFNANNEKIDSLVLVTNEFGSYHAQFRLPQGQLNGKFRIGDDAGHSSQRFSVEEYKRPKFVVDFEKPKDRYRVGDSIRVTGTARGYAGNAVDQGKVKYSIKRVNNPGIWKQPWVGRPYYEPVTIARGTTVTHADGKFTVVFPALPDLRISRTPDARFEYTISADVTDIDGETRSGSIRITAGYTALQLSLYVPGGEKLAADSLRTIVVNASNMSDEPVAAVVHLAIYPLIAPQRLIRERLWPAPDRWVMTEKEWLDSFPLDEYRQETRKENWERGARLWDTAVDIVAQGTRAGEAIINLPAGKLGPGWYAIEAQATDVDGQPVKMVSYEGLYDGQTGRPANPQFVWDLPNPPQAEPGKTVTTATGSSANVYVIRTLQRQSTSQAKAFSHLTLQGEMKTTPWTITDADRGSFTVLDAWVRDNRLYTHRAFVWVPWTNKQLDIRYASFRNKSEPGSAEKWEMRIRGYKGEQVSAEVLTAMYDASLEQFASQSWTMPPLYRIFYAGEDWNDGYNFNIARLEHRDFNQYDPVYIFRVYDRLAHPGEVGNVRKLMVNYRRYRLVNVQQVRGLPSTTIANSGEMLVRGEDAADVAPRAGAAAFASDSTVFDLDAPVHRKLPKEPPPANPSPAAQPRRDFRETAFFLPDLRTDSAGNVSFSFTMPEAVTSWKWMTLAHTRDLAFGYGEKTVVTQKELMVQPNAPRFLREGDRMELPVKVVNLTDSELTGQISLELTDPTTGQTADGWFTNRQANQYFTVAARQSAVVGFPLDIPYQYSRPLTYKVVAQAGAYSDGEEATLPVVSNRILVTESLPLNMPGDGTRHFSFDKLLASGGSETLNHHALTVEFTANPAWYAVQSLPYLMEYPHECSEQVFERVYANALASHIAGASPRLQAAFEKWRTTDTAQLLSNLQKNPELKSVLLEETPWVMEGKSEAQQKKNLALLFDMHRMSTGLQSAADRLVKMQSEDGAFPWWSGGPESRHITQYILTGIGHLQHLKAMSPELAGKLDSIVRAALPYLDAQIKRDYDRERAAEPKGAPTHVSADLISPTAVHYLYMRSFFPERGLPGTAFAAVNYYRKKAQQGWLKCTPYLQGMIALALYRTGDVATAKDIIASLKQNAIRDEERGMYWKGMEAGYYWWQAPVETQSLLIEAFQEISGNGAIDRDLKTWLLKQRQTHNWPTTTATADACYALLMGEAEWLNAERSVDVRLGDKTIDWPAGSGDAGVGYNKKVYDGAFVNPSMGNITVTMTTASGAGSRTTGGTDGRVTGTAGSVADGGAPAWGAVYWQYFDILDRITSPAGTKPALSVTKKLFIRRDTDHGPLLQALADNGELKPGDRVVARIEMRADRDLEYVHMKDMRAACFEPVNVLSQYKWQDGLGYYESTKDASTDFFFDVVPRGTYVFEYDMLAGQSGNFSNGITTIECLYAPEFTWHTESIRVNVDTSN
jgi:hypothetical protein